MTWESSNFFEISKSVALQILALSSKIPRIHWKFEGFVSQQASKV